MGDERTKLRALTSHLLDQPHFRNLATAAIPSQPRLAVPDQSQFAMRRGRRWNIEFQGLRGPRFLNEGMDFLTARAGKANLPARLIPAVYHPHFVMRLRVQSRVMHLYTTITERLSPALPGNRGAIAEGVWVSKAHMS